MSDLINAADSFNLNDLNFITLKEGEWLSNYNSDGIDFSKGLPNGIFNKKYPGMGATYCEFKAPRPSIIVFPFRKLALEKHKTYKDAPTFFVGTDSKNNSTRKVLIQDWYKRNKDKNPKFSVVADSIKKLVEALQEVGCDPYKEFFLVLDETELLQMQSGFRTKLPLCFDYFKEFNSKCLVSATLLDFSVPFLKSLPRYDLEVFTSEFDDEGVHKTKEKQPLQLRYFKKIEPHVGIANQIVDFFESDWDSKRHEKFLIGINSFSGINEMIEVFEMRKTKATISVLVSSNSRDNFYKKYNSLEIENAILPSNINLTSCVNWSGVDVKEKFYAVAISLKSAIHHAFSFENLVQFFGRSRIKENLPPFTFSYKKTGKLKFVDQAVPIKTRVNQLNELLDFIGKNIDSSFDREEINIAISKTNSGLIYLDPSGKPKVNWLLEDLENYEKAKILDYQNKSKSLLSKLQERYDVQEFLELKKHSWIHPIKKTDEERLAETLDRFLDNLEPAYEEINLVQRFFDEKRLQSIRIASYWYLFGRRFKLTEEGSKRLAEEFARLNKPFQITSIVISGLRLYARYHAAYLTMIKKLYAKRNSHKNLNPTEILMIIRSDSVLTGHFESILKSENPGEGISFLMTYFFGLNKIGPSNPKFKIKDGDLDEPILVKQYPILQEELRNVSSRMMTLGLSFQSFNIENLIDEKFEIS